MSVHIGLQSLVLHRSRAGRTWAPLGASSPPWFSASRPELQAPGDGPLGCHSPQAFLTSGNHFPLPIKPGRAWLLWPAERVPRCCLWITFYGEGSLSSGCGDARTLPLSFHLCVKRIACECQGPRYQSWCWVGIPLPKTGKKPCRFPRCWHLRLSLLWLT